MPYQSAAGSRTRTTTSYWTSFRYLKILQEHKCGTLAWFWTSPYSVSDTYLFRLKTASATSVRIRVIKHHRDGRPQK